MLQCFVVQRECVRGKRSLEARARIGGHTHTHNSQLVVKPGIVGSNPFVELSSPFRIPRCLPADAAQWRRTQRPTTSDGSSLLESQKPSQARFKHSPTEAAAPDAGAGQTGAGREGVVSDRQS